MKNIALEVSSNNVRDGVTLFSKIIYFPVMRMLLEAASQPTVQDLCFGISTINHSEYISDLSRAKRDLEHV